jgi:hypothetical protein
LHLSHVPLLVLYSFNDVMVAWLSFSEVMVAKTMISHE